MGAVNRLEDLHVDRTGTFTSAAASVTAVQDWIRIAIQQLDRDGYLVMEDVLAQEAGTAIDAELTALLGPTGRNTFEGTRTRRIYSLLTKTRICDEVVEHPRVLALLDQLLMPNYLLSQLQAISIGP